MKTQLFLIPRNIEKHAKLKQPWTKNYPKNWREKNLDFVEKCLEIATNMQQTLWTYLKPNLTPSVGISTNEKTKFELFYCK